MKLTEDLVSKLILYSDGMVVEKLISIVSNDFDNTNVWDDSLRLQGVVGESIFTLDDYIVYNERYGCTLIRGDKLASTEIVNSLLTSGNYIWILDSNGVVYSSDIESTKWIKSSILHRIIRIRSHTDNSILAITEINDVFVLGALNMYNRSVDFPKGAVDVYYDGTIKYIYPSNQFLKIKNVAGDMGVQSMVISVGDSLDHVLTSHGYYRDGYNPFSINIKTSKGSYRLIEPRNYKPKVNVVKSAPVMVKEEKLSILGGYLQRNVTIDAYDNDLTHQIVSEYENNELFEHSTD